MCSGTYANSYIGDTTTIHWQRIIKAVELTSIFSQNAHLLVHFLWQFTDFWHAELFPRGCARGKPMATWRGKQR